MLINPKGLLSKAFCSLSSLSTFLAAFSISEDVSVLSYKLLKRIIVSWSKNKLLVLGLALPMSSLVNSWDEIFVASSLNSVCFENQFLRADPGTC